MPTFYFTYGTDGTQPYYGGWTEVEAPDMHAACDAFRAYHPNREGNLLNCADVYSAGQFKKTRMAEIGNFGFRCHEAIALRRRTL